LKCRTSGVVHAVVQRIGRHTVECLHSIELNQPGLTPPYGAITSRILWIPSAVSASAEK
jgi:hypothetical protein